MANTKEAVALTGLDIAGGGVTVIIRVSPTNLFTVLIEGKYTVSDLKERIADRGGIAPSLQHLSIGDTPLIPDNKLLSTFPRCIRGCVVEVSADAKIPPKAKAAAAAKAGPTFKFEAYTSSKDATDLSLLESVVSSASSSDATPKVEETNLQQLRADMIKTFATIVAILRPDPKSPDPIAQQKDVPVWPRPSRGYIAYNRLHAKGEITGVATFGLSNPYSYGGLAYHMGSSIELFLEAPSDQARVKDANGVITSSSVADSWMLCTMHELAHQIFALKLEMRELLQRLKVVSVEIINTSVPPEFRDPDTGRCCILLGHLGDPAIPQGFNVVIPGQKGQWIAQTVMFVPVRLLTFAQCVRIRDGQRAARDAMAEEFAKDGSYSVSHVPSSSWPKSNPKK